MEVAISTLLVGLVLVGAMNSLGAVVRGRRILAVSDRAHLLAGQLLGEILEDHYNDPDEPPVFGLEPSEIGRPRATFDDVDDFHNWDAEPPVNRDGIALPGLAGWRRKVSVDFLDPNDLSVVVASDQGIKRIRVDVYQQGTLRSSQTGVRSAAWKGLP